MSYGIIRVRNLGASEIGKTEIHNKRQYDEKGIQRPDNIHPEKEGKFGFNYHTNIEKGQETEKSLQEILQNRFNQLGIKPRKNSVHAIEYVLALSPDCQDAYKDTYDADAMLSNLTEFVTKKHGRKNVISVSKHFDESNPHVHMIVVPILEKEKRWKNRHGEGKKKVHTLSARDFTGGPDKLRKLQNDFFEFVKPFGKRLGKEFFRGTLVEKRKKEYVRKTDHKIGELRAKLATLENDLDKAKIKEQINEIKGDFEAEIESFDNTIEKIKKRRKKDGNWKKREEYFHGHEKEKEQKQENKPKKDKNRGKSLGM